jgi:eukaryotic-like serine/threonine-protein kinase
MPTETVTRRDPGRASKSSIVEARPSFDDSDQFPAGTEIADYRIEELRRQGGSASLYRATRIDSGDRVALKILHRHLTADGYALERFRREAEAVNQLYHPLIVRILACGAFDVGRPFIAMEWLDGRNLDDELAARGPLSPAESLALMEQLGSALTAAHERGIIHRDLKASNVMAVPRDGWFTVKLVDFGTVKLLRSEPSKRDVTRTGESPGTPLTMAPEQILGEPVDERTDIYGLGLLLYQTLTGELPFRGTTAMETEELHLHAPVPRMSDLVGVPPAIDAVVQRSLEKSRLRRHPSVAEFLADLRAAITSRPSAAAPTEATMIGVYVQARAPQGAVPDANDELLDDVERVLAAARSALSSLDLELAMESAEAVLGAAALPDDPTESARLRRRVLEMALELAERLANRQAPQAHLSITAHVASASTRSVRGRLLLDGDLLRVREWTTGLPTGGVVATDPALAGLEPTFRTTLIRPGSRLVRRR